MPRLVHLCHIYLLVSYVQLDNGHSPSKTIVFWITGLTQTASARIKGAILIGGEGQESHERYRRLRYEDQ